MFQLLIFLASVFGATIVRIVDGTAYLAELIVTDCDDCGFNDLGKLLFGGVILAIIAGVLISVARRRMSTSVSHASEFVSIKPSDNKL